MCCENIRPLLSAFVDGALDEAERIRVEEHLAACDACASEAKLFRELTGEVGSLPSMKAPPGFARALREKLDTHDAEQRTMMRPATPSRFRRPLWLGIAASFILAGVTIAFLIVSQIKMHSLTDNAASMSDRQVADRAAPAPRDIELMKQLESLGYVSSPEGKSEGITAPRAPKRAKKGRNSYAKDQDTSAASRLPADGAFTEVPNERQKSRLSEEQPPAEPEAETALMEAAEPNPEIPVEKEETTGAHTDSDLILVVDSKGWRIPERLVAMAKSEGGGIMDFSARIDLPHESSESYPPRERRKRKQGKGSKGTGKAPGGGLGGVTVDRTVRNSPEPASSEMKNEISSDGDWVCVYLDAEADAIPELLKDLALPPESSVWRGKLIPVGDDADTGQSTRTPESVDENGGKTVSPFRGYEVTVSKIPWIDNLVAMGYTRSEPDSSLADSEKEGTEPSSARPSVDALIEKSKHDMMNRAAGEIAVSSTGSVDKKRAETLPVRNVPSKNKGAVTDQIVSDGNMGSEHDLAAGGLKKRMRILLIVPKRAVRKQVIPE